VSELLKKTTSPPAAWTWGGMLALQSGGMWTWEWLPCLNTLMGQEACMEPTSACIVYAYLIKMNGGKDWISINSWRCMRLQHMPPPVLAVGPTLRLRSRRQVVFFGNLSVTWSFLSIHWHIRSFLPKIPSAAAAA
jgi:hypothetical protein